MNRDAAIQVEEAIQELVPKQRFRPYPAYAHSGLEWLRELPQHWPTKRLRFLLTTPLQYGANEPAELDDMSLPRYIRITDIDDDGTLRDDTFKSLPEEVAHPYLLVSGDLLFARSGATVGKTFLYNESWGRAAYAGYLIRARLDQRQLLPRFAAFYTNSVQYWQWLSSSTIQATIQNVSAEKYANLSIPIPPLGEQKAIAAFLDRETARIDELVAKKRRLIELLTEKRTALISHAVTKGLNPDAPMKNSGIEWLGQVPNHWERQSVGQLCYLGRGKVMSNIYMQDHSGEFPVYSSQTDESGAMGWIDSFMFDGEYLTWTTDGANAGTVFYRRGKFSCTNVCGTLKAKVDVSLAYLQYALATETRRYVRLDINPKLMNNVMARIRVLVPPHNEQHAIATFLDRETTRMDELVGRVHEAIDKLREYRSALISAAVTGKIDVREVQM